MEEIDENNMNLSSEQISELVHLLEKEAVIESEHAHKTQDSEQTTKSSSKLSKKKLEIPVPEDTKTIPAAKKDLSKTKPKTNSKTL